MPVLSLHDDQVLLSGLKAGDEHALRLIYRKYWKLLYNEACRRLNDPQACEELVQDLLADLWEKRGQREIGNLEAYLVSGVKYAVFRLYRKKQALPFFEEPLEHLHLADAQADTALFLKELQTFIDHWLAAQPEKRREIFSRRYEQDKSTKTISEEMNIPQKTVQNTLRNMMTGLRADIAKMLILLPILMDHHK